MHQTIMSRPYLTLFALPLLFCTCGPAQLEPVLDGQFLETVNQDTTLTGDPDYARPRLILDGDSIRTYGAFWGASPALPVYAADTSARFQDSMYVVYQPLDGDDGITVNYYHHQYGYGPSSDYRRVPTIDHRGPSETVIGKTYRFDVEGQSVMIYFKTLSDPVPLTYTRDTTGDEAYDFRNVFPMQLPNGDQTSSISYGQNIGNNQVRIHRLVVLATEDGTPQLYFREGYIYEPDVVKGPYVGELYPSLVPDDEADQNLFLQLSRGRLEVQPLPPEPDSLQTHYRLDYFLEHGGLRKSDVPKLDFVFREDGSYTLLTGERILREGFWKISADRNFIIFSKFQDDFQSEYRYLTEYNDEYLSFSIPYTVLADRQIAEGERISVYTPEVGVRFYR